MTIEQMKANKERELNNTERMELCYIAQNQLDYLNSYNEKHGSDYRWDSDSMKAFFTDRQIEFIDIEGWTPCFIYVDRITYNSNYQTYCFPVVFGRSVCNMYAYPNYVAVPNDVEEAMKKLKTAEANLPF